MEHIAAFMLLIACSDDLQICEEKPTSQVAYETVEQCDLDISNQIAMQDVFSPVVVAKCVPVDPLLAEANVEIVWSFEGEELLVAFESDAIDTANQLAQVN